MLEFRGSSKDTRWAVIIKRSDMGYFINLLIEENQTRLIRMGPRDAVAIAEYNVHIPNIHSPPVLVSRRAWLVCYKNQYINNVLL